MTFVGLKLPRCFEVLRCVSFLVSRIRTKTSPSQATGSPTPTINSSTAALMDDNLRSFSSTKASVDSEQLMLHCEELQEEVEQRDTAAREGGRLLLADPAILFEKWKRYGRHSAEDDYSFRRRRHAIAEMGLDLGKITE